MGGSWRALRAASAELRTHPRRPRGATGDHFEHRPKLTKRESPIDWQQRVRSLLEGGLSHNEIIHCMRDTDLTEKEIQEMIAYAQHWGKSGG